jgi:hypothetical protein
MQDVLVVHVKDGTELGTHAPDTTLLVHRDREVVDI